MFSENFHCESNNMIHVNKKSVFFAAIDSPELPFFLPSELAWVINDLKLDYEKKMCVKKNDSRLNWVGKWLYPATFGMHFMLFLIRSTLLTNRDLRICMDIGYTASCLLAHIKLVIVFLHLFHVVFGHYTIRRSGNKQIHFFLTSIRLMGRETRRWAGNRIVCSTRYEFYYVSFWCHFCLVSFESFLILWTRPFGRTN